jgi:7,8-dihydroneopterin aldolase/epimerase/oxygenase
MAAAKYARTILGIGGEFSRQLHLVPVKVRPLEESVLKKEIGSGKVLLSGIKIRPNLGVDAAERNVPQDCEADVAVWVNCKTAATTDELNRGLDYRLILKKVLEIAESREYSLLETLAYLITVGILHAFPVAKVSVKVRKRPAALAGLLGYVEVEVEESRTEAAVEA